MSNENKEFHFGEGKISGVLSVLLSTLTLAAVFCFHFPEYLTTPQLRAWYPIEFFRTLLTVFIFFSFLMGVISFILSKRKTFSIIGMSLALTCVLLGGGNIETPESLDQQKYLGLDWFILDLLIVALIFIPLEQFFFRLKQKIFRPLWKTDLYHFLFSHLLIQTTSFLILLPSLYLGVQIANPKLQNHIQSQPILLQLIEIMFFADLVQYVVHRLFHQIPLLWRFHAIHHSAKHMDWLAGSRLHLVDIVVTRALTLIPLFILGFHQTALQIYLVFVAFWATFLHANVHWKFNHLKHIFVMPRHHHWHHAAQKEAINKNFAIHFPFLDHLFNSYYAPENQWPEKYGLEHQQVPPDYLGQTLAPFFKKN